MTQLYPLLMSPAFDPRPWGTLDLSAIYPNQKFNERIGEAWLTGDYAVVAGQPGFSDSFVEFLIGVDGGKIECAPGTRVEGWRHQEWVELGHGRLQLRITILNPLAGLRSELWLVLLKALPDELAFMVLTHLVGLRHQREVVTFEDVVSNAIFTSLSLDQRLLDMVCHCGT